MAKHVNLAKLHVALEYDPARDQSYWCIFAHRKAERPIYRTKCTAFAIFLQCTRHLWGPQ